ncbi:MAG: amidohydrolase [Acidobacteriota bacterium]
MEKISALLSLKILSAATTCLCWLFLSWGCSGQASIQAELAIINGKIWTVDNDVPLAEAVAVWKGKILKVGSNKEIQKLTGPKTEVINVEGRLVLPGFCDSHTHFVDGGFHLMGVKLKDAESPEEFGRLLAEKSKELPQGALITGGNWDHDKWPGGNLPTAELIDRYVPDRPVLVSRYDGHMSVANSLALKMAGITAQTPDPPGGIIVRDPQTREPTGVLRETAARLVSRIIPPPQREEIKKAIQKSLEHAREHGITSIHQVDMTPTDLEIYQELLGKGELTSRIYGFIAIDQCHRLIELGIHRNFNNKNWIAVGGVKAFLDGSLGSSTALFFEPYDQDPSSSGIFVVNPDELKKQMMEADKAGLQLAVHSIGDRANSALLDMFEHIIKENGPRDRRLRIEHAQHLQSADFQRFNKLNVIASVQPYHAIDDARFAEKRIGLKRCETTYAFHSFLENDVIMAFGSDWTVAPLDVLWGIYAAVTRKPLDGSHPEGWFPEQKISVEQAIRAYTYNPAYASFQEDIKGTISSGKLADIVVLSRDILTISPEEIKETEILYTITNGQIVYKKDL